MGPPRCRRFLDGAAVNAPFKITVAGSRLRQTRASEYAVRFVFGGIVTASAGLIAARAGPVVGGLFLAFPAILPASLTLISRHARNRPPAGADCYGSIFGSVGLLGFAAVVWRLGVVLPAWTLLLLALVVWIVLASLSWAAAESVRYHMRLRRSYSRDAESPGDLRDASTGTPKPPAFAESRGSSTSRKC